MMPTQWFTYDLKSPASPCQTTSSNAERRERELPRWAPDRAYHRARESPRAIILVSRIHRLQIRRRGRAERISRFQRRRRLRTFRRPPPLLHHPLRLRRRRASPIETTLPDDAI